MMPGKKKDKTSIFVQDENEHGVRARWMKSSFLRLNWPWILSYLSEGYAVAQCPLFLHDKYSYKLVIPTTI